MRALRKVIMLVDDAITNLKLGKAALADAYDVFTVPSAEKMLELLDRNKPSLILLDVNMPGINGYEAIKILKERPDTREIPVIFLTAMGDVSNELMGLNMGAVDYIVKPFSPPLLRKRVALHLLVQEQHRELRGYAENLQRMVEEKTRTVVTLQSKILRTVAELVESRDSTTGSHVERTRHCLGVLVSGMLEKGIYSEEASAWDLELVQQSSQLHDVGKISIRDSILQKPGKLTPEEFQEMQQHAAFGVNIISRIADGDQDSAFLEYAKVMAATHHERWDGSGYPLGLRGEEIPLLGRVMAIVDVYDALISWRPYKNPFSHQEAVDIIRDGQGTHFDPLLVSAFLQVSDLLPTNWT
ncbi:MAG: response regulator [Deltaproteobacteria bacterium]|jgi:putative two-component system response regulator|nr:response regulator [Deltaproteobacteria bacterium]